MNSLTLGFSRTIGGCTEQMEDLSFQKGDFYNIYTHTVSDAGLGGTGHSIERFHAFEITGVGNSEVEIKTLYPITDIKLKLALNESGTLEFGKYGIYTLTLKKVW